MNSEKGDTGLPGLYRAGGYYDSNRYAFLDDSGRRADRELRVLPGWASRWCTGTAGSGATRGLSLFGALIFAPHSASTRFPGFASAGASYRGLVPGRDDDTAAFALYYGGFSRDLPGQTYELVFEWTYAIAVSGWLTVQPDVQYVINPGGRSSVGNAVVVGSSSR